MKIGIIATYHDMVITAEKLKKRPDVEFIISEATYDAGVQEANRMRAEGADIVISRGATLHYIEQRCSIPTVSCAFGAMDIIYALQEARHLGSHIGVVTYTPVPVERKVIADLFQTNITFIDGYDNPQRNLRCVLEMKEQGIDVVVGGGMTAQMAQMNGLKSVLITTRLETLENAVDEAIHMLNIIQRDRMELEQISQIIRYASDAILLTTLDGSVLMTNASAGELLEELSGGAPVHSLTELPRMAELLTWVRTGKSYMSELHNIGETMFLCSQYPIWMSGRLTGMALFLQQTSRIQKLERNIRTHLYKKPGLRYTLDSCIGESQGIRKCRQMARAYADFDSTVLIIGESGTGKEIMAQSIHNLSARRDEPFVAVNCNAIESTLLDSELFDFGERGKFEVSLVDAGNPLVFISARSLGMTGIETPAEIEANKALMDTIELIRGRAAVRFGLVEREEEAAAKSPYVPFFAIVSPARSYDCYNGVHVSEDEIDVVSRLLFMLKMHKTYPGTGTVCTGCAGRIPGSVLWDQLSDEARSGTVLRIGHPAGVIPVEATAEERDGEIFITRAAFYRTARKIMDGQVYVKNAVFGD